MYQLNLHLPSPNLFIISLAPQPYLGHLLELEYQACQYLCYPIINNHHLTSEHNQTMGITK